jgi:hypothetical protein
MASTKQGREKQAIGATTIFSVDRGPRLGQGIDEDVSAAARSTHSLHTELAVVFVDFVRARPPRSRLVALIGGSVNFLELLVPA